MISTAMADTQGIDCTLVLNSALDHGPQNRRDRFYYHTPRWPWMLLSTRGLTLSGLNGKLVVVSFNGFLLPTWNMPGKYLREDGKGLANLFDLGPHHWQAGYYKVSMFEASEAETGRRTSTLATNVFDSAQALAFGPFITALSAGVLPPTLDAVSVQMMAGITLHSAARDVPRLAEMFALAQNC